MNNVKSRMRNIAIGDKVTFSRTHGTSHFEYTGVIGDIVRHDGRVDYLDEYGDLIVSLDSRKLESYKARIHGYSQSLF